MQKTNIRHGAATKLLALFGLLFLIGWGLVGTLSAQTLNQAYKSDQVLQTGMLVRQKAGDNSKVEPASQDKPEDIKGVVVNKNDSPVVIAASDENVFVANNGSHTVLVSNENGSIRKGDYLSISSLDGIAMKATNDQPVVVGKALADFNGSGDSIGTTTLKADNKRVSFGRIKVDITVGANPWQTRVKIQTVPKILRDVSGSVAGKPVSNARIWLASIIFLTTSVVTGVMLYAGARNSLLAMGRNPLSKSSILRGLIQVVLLGLIIFICGMFGVYLLLKL